MTSQLAPWLAVPLARFVRESRVRMALVLEPSGRVLAQHGFTRSLDVMAACSLVAAIHASASELGRQLDGVPFGPLHHAGTSQQVFLAPTPTETGAILLLAVFDATSSLGIVRHFFAAFAGQVAGEHAGNPAPPPRLEDLERDLGASLAMLFGRA
jgi:hypothetical protein